MANITTRSGIDLIYDRYDKSEHFKITTHKELNRSIEFYLKDNISNYSKGLIVGAGVGLYSAILDQANVQTINIEPVQDRFELLEQNVGNNATNYRKACSSISGNGTINYFTDNRSGAQLNTGIGNGSEDIDVITIDSLNLTDLDVMVIIANGKEVDILKGAVDTISNNPNMKILIHWNYLLIDNTEDYQYIIDNFSPKIIHCEADGITTTIGELGSETYPITVLKAVIDTTLLLN